MSKIREHAIKSLKQRVARLHRLIEMEAPDIILVSEAWLVAQSAQMLAPDRWFSIERERLMQDVKRGMQMCEQDGCEEPVAWIPHAESGAPPGPFHTTLCETHAAATEKEMAEEESEEDESDDHDIQS